jgi:hypothetical protein
MSELVLHHVMGTTLDTMKPPRLIHSFAEQPPTSLYKGLTYLPFPLTLSLK